MSEHLEKGKAALEAAKAIAEDAEVDLDSPLERRAPLKFARCLDIANVQAQLAQAEALERIAVQLERKPPPASAYLPLDRIPASR